MAHGQYIAYGDLAWTENIIASVEDAAKDTELCCSTIKEHSKIESKTLLHLGCGAGMHDYSFKKFFTVTGVDKSEQMLALAGARNPEVAYVNGDMRSIKLNDRFDAVAIPDSIGYMTTEKDLLDTLKTARDHLKSGGVLLVIAHTREQFKENNFVYTGSKGDTEITLFENNHITEADHSVYEATLVYLIRQKGKLKIYSDCHLLGLFKSQTWVTLLQKTDFETYVVKLKDSYGRFILGQGEYPLTMFIGVKQ